MPAADITVTAQFELLPANTYLVSFGNFEHGNVSGPNSATAGDTVTLNVTPDSGYRLKGGSLKVNNGAVAISGSYTFTMPAENVTVTAQFEGIPYTIAITPSANGTVTASPTSAAIGTSVTLTATPNTDFRLQSVTVTKTDSEHVPITGSGNNYTFTMPADNVTVTATFESQQSGTYTINLGTCANGYVTSTVTEATEGIQYIGIVAHPNEGYRYVYRTLTVTKAGGGTVSVFHSPQSDSTDGTFTRPADNVTVTAQFELEPYTISVTPLGSGNSITAKVGSTNVTTATMGATVTLMATPASGYELQSVTVTKTGNEQVTGNLSGNNYTFTMPASAVTVTAIFGIVGNYPIDIQTVGYGTVTSAPTDSAAAGSTITLTVTANQSYRLKANSLTVKRNDNQQTVVVTQDGTAYKFTMPVVGVTVSAEFESDDYRITVISSANGTITIKSPISGMGVNTRPVVLTVSPNAGYRLDGSPIVKRTDDNAQLSVKYNNAYDWQFSMPSSEVTVNATFILEETYTAGLYETVGGTLTEIKTDGTSIVGLDAALTYIKDNGANKKMYTIVLNSDTTASGYIIGKNGKQNGKDSNTGKWANLTITLRGTTDSSTITKTGTGPLFTVYGFSADEPTLILHNITLKGNANNTSPLVITNNSGNYDKGILKMEQGSRITGNGGGGVKIEKNGAFNMNGGTIDGNSAANGAAVFGVSGATFDKTGGTIYGKTGNNANTVTGSGHVIEVGSNWRDTDAGENVNTADSNFWEN
jgi:azurin